VLIKKYGTTGSHLEQQKLALERLKIRPEAPRAVPIARPAPEDEPQAEAAAPAEDAPVEKTDDAGETVGSAAEENE
jgi:small subunit ribosomal protein S16